MKAKTSPRQKSFSSAEKRLHKTCDQMEHLESRISLLRSRHQRALKRACGAAAESLGLQLYVLEGVYAMYYSYAETQCQQLSEALTTRGQCEE